MKKILLVLTLILLLFASVSSVSADGTPQLGRGRMQFSLVGEITAIDGSTVTVRVWVGNFLVKKYYAQDLQLQTNELTRFLMKNTDGTVIPITLADLELGQKVSVNGKLANQVWIAKRITVGARMLHLP